MHRTGPPIFCMDQSSPNFSSCIDRSSLIFFCNLHRTGPHPPILRKTNRSLSLYSYLTRYNFLSQQFTLTFSVPLPLFRLFPNRQSSLRLTNHTAAARRPASLLHLCRLQFSHSLPLPGKKLFSIYQNICPFLPLIFASNF
jgi:hypothetical protein